MVLKGKLQLAQRPRMLYRPINGSAVQTVSVTGRDRYFS